MKVKLTGHARVECKSYNIPEPATDFRTTRNIFAIGLDDVPEHAKWITRQEFDPKKVKSSEDYSAAR
jgi:hypothetical protein